MGDCNSNIERTLETKPRDFGLVYTKKWVPVSEHDMNALYQCV